MIFVILSTSEGFTLNFPCMCNLYIKIMSILWETTELQQNDFSEVMQEVYIRMKELGNL